MMAPAPIDSVYAIDSLVSIFAEALKAKEEKVNSFFANHPNANWARFWPGGNSAAEQFVVDWLAAQQAGGADRIRTAHPISGDGPLSNPHHSLFMQIRAGQAKGLVP